jgi:hypothetical protein
MIVFFGYTNKKRKMNAKGMRGMRIPRAPFACKGFGVLKKFWGMGKTGLFWRGHCCEQWGHGPGLELFLVGIMLRAAGTIPMAEAHCQVNIGADFFWPVLSGYFGYLDLYWFNWFSILISQSLTPSIAPGSML